MFGILVGLLGACGQGSGTGEPAPALPTVTPAPTTPGLPGIIPPKTSPDTTSTASPNLTATPTLAPPVKDTPVVVAPPTTAIAPGPTLTVALGPGCSQNGLEIEGLVQAVTTNSLKVNDQTYLYDPDVLVENGKTPQVGGKVHVSLRCQNGQYTVRKVIAQGPSNGNGASGGEETDKEGQDKNKEKDKENNDNGKDKGQDNGGKPKK